MTHRVSPPDGLHPDEAAHRRTGERAALLLLGSDPCQERCQG